MSCKPKIIDSSMSRDRIQPGTWILETSANVVGISDKSQKYYVNFAGTPSGGVVRVWKLYIKKTSYLIFANDTIERHAFMLDGSTPLKFDIERI